MKPIPKESYFEVEVFRDADPEETECYQIGLIHDLDLPFIDQFEHSYEIDGIIDSLSIEDIEWPDQSWIAVFKFSNFAWDEGEEFEAGSGLWCQRPSWEYTCDFLRFEYLEEE